MLLVLLIHAYMNRSLCILIQRKKACALLGGQREGDWKGRADRERFWCRGSKIHRKSEKGRERHAVSEREE